MNLNHIGRVTAIVTVLAVSLPSVARDANDHREPGIWDRDAHPIVRVIKVIAKKFRFGGVSTNNDGVLPPRP